jgi:hypothetical protein
MITEKDPDSGILHLKIPLDGGHFKNKNNTYLHMYPFGSNKMQVLEIYHCSSTFPCIITHMLYLPNKNLLSSSQLCMQSSLLSHILLTGLIIG